MDGSANPKDKDNQNIAKQCHYGVYCFLTMHVQATIPFDPARSRHTEFYVMCYTKNLDDLLIKALFVNTVDNMTDIIQRLKK